jgi:uncharacterized membrane protein YqaE (UPF0057 family)
MFSGCLKVVVSVFLAFIFPPILIVMWKGRRRDFLITLAVFLFLMAFVRPYAGLSSILAVIFLIDSAVERRMSE